MIHPKTILAGNSTDTSASGTQCFIEAQGHVKRMVADPTAPDSVRWLYKLQCWLAPAFSIRDLPIPYWVTHDHAAPKPRTSRGVRTSYTK